MNDPVLLCDSITSKPMPKWMALLAIAFGVVFLYTAFRDYLAGSRSISLLYNFLMGVVCLYGAGISRKIYLSDRGVVREMHAWGRIVRRELPWKNVRYVTLAFRGDKMMAFFEVETTGWKVLFSRDQEERVRDILDEMIPDVEVADLGEATGSKRNAGGK
mgnify:FL=1